MIHKNYEKLCRLMLSSILTDEMLSGAIQKNVGNSLFAMELIFVGLA